MERDRLEYDIGIVTRTLFNLGNSVEDVSDKLRKLGHLANPTADKKGVSVSLEPYDGAVHPKTKIILQNPPVSMSYGMTRGFSSEPE